MQGEGQYLSPGTVTNLHLDHGGSVAPRRHFHSPPLEAPRSWWCFRPPLILIPNTAAPLCTPLYLTLSPLVGRSWHRVFPRTSVSQEAYLPIPFSSAVVSPYINKRRLLVYVVLGISPPPFPSSHESNSFPPSTTFRAAG